MKFWAVFPLNTSLVAYDSPSAGSCTLSVHMNWRRSAWCLRQWHRLVHISWGKLMHILLQRSVPRTPWSLLNIIFTAHVKSSFLLTCTNIVDTDNISGCQPCWLIKPQRFRDHLRPIIRIVTSRFSNWHGWQPEKILLMFAPWKLQIILLCVTYSCD